MTDKPTIAVSMSRKVNLERVLGPKFRYESAECFVSISGVSTETTPAQMAALMDTGKVAWEMVRATLLDQVADAIDVARNTARKEESYKEPAF